MLYNLRASLDYLVFALAWHDSGQEPHGGLKRSLQFPIFDDKKGFDGAKKRQLARIADEHAEAIEKYQPYSGCAWSAKLRDLGNQDKHRRLHLLIGGFDTYAQPHYRQEVVSHSEAIITDEGNWDPPHDIRTHMSQLEIVLADGRPLLEVLEPLHRGVGSLISDFSDEFRLAPID
jgi:hypothetical protein